jgi:hypothetical protein
MTQNIQPELFDTNLARQRCALSYRPSASAQDLTIQGTWSPPSDDLAIGLESYGREMSQGFAGDANNSPIDGKAVFKKAPHLSGFTGPLASMDAVIEVQSVSPWYMQFFFKMLKGGCTSLNVAGSLRKIASTSNYSSPAPTTGQHGRESGRTSRSRSTTTKTGCDVQSRPRSSQARPGTRPDVRTRPRVRRDSMIH